MKLLQEKTDNTNPVALAIFVVPLLICAGMSSCSLSDFHEARAIVAEADSLRAEGMMCSDSIGLAEAYETLGKWQWCYADEYAHACYHYGRLLRDKDNPVTAMQCFINATHSRTHDYHILGRVYSNMGTLCHLAEEYPLSYDMYERCSEMFLRNGDSLLYYYGLNNMAFELAEQGRKEDALSLLAKIQTACTNGGVIIKILETKAEIYIKAGQPDSAACCIKELNLLGYKDPAGMLIMAQSFSRMGIRDSAILYANCVLSDTNSSFQNRFNALYLLSHNDTTLNQDEIRVIASEREDIRYYEYEPLKEQLVNAVQLLMYDLHHKPDLRWLYVMIATICVIGLSIFVYIYRKRKQHQLLTQQIGDLENTASTIQQKHNELTELYITNQQRIKDDILNKCELLRHNKDFTTHYAWNDFERMNSAIDQQFYMLALKLRRKEVLNETELRLCVLVLVGFSRVEIAEMLPYALNSVGKLKDHTAKLLGTTGKNLRDFLLNLAIEG